MKHRHYIIHKPYGYLSQFKLAKQGKKRLLGELYEFAEGVMSIGRLDEHSEGLLLLTTNGKESARINGNQIEKEYYAQVDGLITDEAILSLQNGVEISIEGKKYKTKPCQAKKIEDPNFPERSRRIRGDHHGPTTWVSITLREGKFRQVRKMTAVAGFPTLRLVRIRVGEIVLGDMKSGDVIEVDQLEV